MEEQDYVVQRAQYAKGRMIVRPIGDRSGYKTRVCYLAEALGGRWVNRSRGYNMSLSAVEKLRTLHEAGFNASVRIFADTKPHFYHSEEGFRDLSAREALEKARALLAARGAPPVDCVVPADA